MKPRPSWLCLPALLLSLTAATATPTAAEVPEARLLRFPDIHHDFVVFVHAGDIWRAPAAGGEARRLTSHPGVELFPKISHDGRWIAFSAENSGSRQVWVMPAEGGEARQLTFYGDVGAMPPRGGWDYWIQDWTPDGKILVRANRTPWGRRMGRLYLIDPEGGLETPLALPETGGASLSPDATQLAYCPVGREFRTWKRTRGGRAQDVWIYDLEAQRSERLTTDPGTDNSPMWSGDTVYFTSDREHTLNLYAHELTGGALHQLTHHETFDVMWPSLGPASIVYQHGGELRRLDLASGESAPIPVRIGSELPYAGTRFEDVADDVRTADLSPSAARVVFGARGELFSVPAEDGPTRNLSRTQGVREINPAWSPDGQHIAYLSDATGEYELYVRPQDGSGEPRQLTANGNVWRFQPVWSPDSAKLAFGDRDRRLWILDVAGGALTEVDRGRQVDINTYTFSPDSRWLAYGQNHESRLPGIRVYSLEQGTSVALGDGLTADFSPVWSSDGDTLFFLSNRDYQMRFSNFEFNYLFDRATRVYAAALNPDAPPLFPPRSDEEEGDGDDDEDDGDEEDEGETAVEPVVVQAEGFETRTLTLPGLEAGNYTNLAAADGAVFYLHSADGPSLDLYRYDLEEREASMILPGVDGFELSSDGGKLLYLAGDTWGIVETTPEQATGDGALDLSGLVVKLDLRAEWQQMFDDAWRIARDWFYDPDMHGVDWPAIRQRYGALVPHVGHRGDLDFIFGEMVGELAAGHTYVNTGDEHRVERVEGGKLGCELLPDGSGLYRVGRIYAGEGWDDAFRSPLTEPGVNVPEGTYLLAIDGEPLRAPDNPYRLLENKADTSVVLTVSGGPSWEGAREVTVRPVASELNLLYLDWVKSRMALTEELSGGRIGYIHLPDTAFSGNRMLQKLFYGQADKEALILDDRYNGGGFIPDRMLEMLARTTLSYWARRDVAAMRTPGFAHDGPKAMLINGYSASGGDALPYYFKQRGLGKLIGTRTWGGLIGLTGNPALADGGSVSIPSFRIYDTEGKWVVENYGVAPDIEVQDLPELRIAGGDPSLEKAIEVLLAELAERGAARPEPPAPPVMGRRP